MVGKVDERLLLPDAERLEHLGIPKFIICAYGSINLSQALSASEVGAYLSIKKIYSFMEGSNKFVQLNPREMLLQWTTRRGHKSVINFRDVTDITTFTGSTKRMGVNVKVNYFCEFGYVFEWPAKQSGYVNWLYALFYLWKKEQAKMIKPNGNLMNDIRLVTWCKKSPYKFASVDTVRECLDILKLNLHPFYVKKMFAEVNVDRSQYISYLEFKLLLELLLNADEIQIIFNSSVNVRISLDSLAKYFSLTGIYETNIIANRDAAIQKLKALGTPYVEDQALSIIGQHHILRGPINSILRDKALPGSLHVLSSKPLTQFWIKYLFDPFKSYCSHGAQYNNANQVAALDTQYYTAKILDQNYHAMRLILGYDRSEQNIFFYTGNPSTTTIMKGIYRITRDKTVELLNAILAAKRGYPFITVIDATYIEPADANYAFRSIISFLHSDMSDSVIQIPENSLTNHNVTVGNSANLIVPIFMLTDDMMEIGRSILLPYCISSPSSNIGLITVRKVNEELFEGQRPQARTQDTLPGSPRSSVTDYSKISKFYKEGMDNWRIGIISLEAEVYDLLSHILYFAGCQLVPCDICEPVESTPNALFRATDGFRLKPDSYSTGAWYRIEIRSGFNLMRPAFFSLLARKSSNDSSLDELNTQIVVYVHNYMSATLMLETSIIKKNGLNPLFKFKTEFHVDNPEMCVLTVELRHISDTGFLALARSCFTINDCKRELGWLELNPIYRTCSSCGTSGLLMQITQIK